MNRQGGNKNIHIFHLGQMAKGIKNIWWVKVTVPTKTLYILNAEVVLVTVWGIASLDLRG